MQRLLAAAGGCQVGSSSIRRPLHLGTVVLGQPGPRRQQQRLWQQRPAREPSAVCARPGCLASSAGCQAVSLPLLSATCPCSQLKLQTHLFGRAGSRPLAVLAAAGACRPPPPLQQRQRQEQGPAPLAARGCWGMWPHRSSSGSSWSSSSGSSWRGCSPGMGGRKLSSMAACQAVMGAAPGPLLQGTALLQPRWVLELLALPCRAAAARAPRSGPNSSSRSTRARCRLRLPGGPAGLHRRSGSWGRPQSGRGLSSRQRASRWMMRHCCQRRLWRVPRRLQLLPSTWGSPWLAWQQWQQQDRQQSRPQARCPLHQGQPRSRQSCLRRCGWRWRQTRRTAAAAALWAGQPLLRWKQMRSSGTCCGAMRRLLVRRLGWVC